MQSSFVIDVRQERGKIIPVFLPFAGCPFTCLYCLQDKQTGEEGQSLVAALLGLEARVADIVQEIANGREYKKIEIAFYGGTFTALAKEDLDKCLLAFAKAKEALEKVGVQIYGRCSTRPDCLGFKDTEFSKKDGQLLKKIKSYGIDLIELGIQSFDDLGLKALGRGYGSVTAKEACYYVKDQGLKLGIQLMPGAPSFKEDLCVFGDDFYFRYAKENFNILNNIHHDEQENKLHKKFFAESVATFFENVKTAISFHPECMRYYPFLVVEGTAFGKLWHKKVLNLWSGNDCINALGYALHLAHRHTTPVIRLSVAPEEGFDTQVLAGFRHPSLGSMVKARALLYDYAFALENLFFTKKMTLEKDIVDNSVLSEISLLLPKKAQGHLFGYQNFLKKEWEEIFGKTKIEFYENNSKSHNKMLSMQSENDISLDFATIFN